VDGGFVDLRQPADAGGGNGNDSFWPSFTDIMMVVVMIFMLASTFLVVRNWDLVRELRATIEAEREAEALARSMTETSATLEERLAQAQHALSELRMQLMRANEVNRATQTQLGDTEQRLLDSEAEREQLSSSLTQAQRELRLAEDRYRQLSDTSSTLEQRLQETLAEIRQLEQARDTQSEEMAELRQKFTVSEQQFAMLQGDYDDLEVKYNKLIKPARSARGKHVVSVRYWKEGKYYQIRLKDMDEEKYQTVSRKQLHQRLTELKDKYGGKLYVKVIIPDDSGLSYSEAWGFTFNILKEYDYYHQDQPGGSSQE
jgi:chromosome segregation ATPase